MIRSTEEKTMQKAAAITCLFVDIGGVCSCPAERATTNFTD